MTTGPATSISNNDQGDGANGDFDQNWAELKADTDIQFAPVDLPAQPPREPNWFDQAMEQVGHFLEGLFSWFPAIWPIFKWVLLGAAILLALYIIYRVLEPYLGRSKSRAIYEESEMEWQPNAAQSAALLEDADRLAAEGKFDEATHLLLKRSVTHMSEAKPDWVEPSSTARELAAIAAMPDKARETFGVIAERVERSLFALRKLERDDWETARSAYADFAATSLRNTSV